MRKSTERSRERVFPLAPPILQMAGAADSLAVLMKRRKDRSYEQDNNSFLHAACYYGDYDAALMLLLANHNMSERNVWQETPLHQCTAQGHLDVMLLMLDGGADVNACDKDNYTPLHHAVIRANVNAAELLLCYGASLFSGKVVNNAITCSPVELSEHNVCYKVLHEAEGM